MVTPKKILVRAPNWVGDQILAYPFFYYLRKAFPQAHITSVCVPWVEAIQFKDLINDVFVLPRMSSMKWTEKLKALEGAAQALKSKGPWDYGIALPNSFSSAWLLFRAGVKVRRGYAAEGRGFLLNEKDNWEPFKESHRIDAYLNLLPKPPVGLLKEVRSSHDFWGEAPESELDPFIPGEVDSFYPESSWPETEVIEPPSQPFWVLAPGSMAESRRWPVERFAEVARKIAEQTNWVGLVVGGVAETEMALELTEDKSLRLQDWTAKGSVASYWKVFRQAQLCLCNDSGLAHVASLCGGSVQVVWGAGEPKCTEPKGPGKSRILFNPVECWPCEKNVCLQEDGRKLECLYGIQPEEVWKEIQTGFRMEKKNSS